MIRKEEVYRIGTLGKPHGIKGEISFHFTDDIFDRTDECDYLVCMMDGILVPFYMDEYRFKNDSVVLVKFDGINTAEEVKRLVGIDVYFPVKYAEESDELSWNYFVGFRVVDECCGELGTIESVDETTINTIVTLNNKQLIPLHEDFIINIEPDKQLITICLPFIFTKE